MEEAKKPVDLNGSFRFKTDAKGRVSLPAKFRKVLSEDLVVTTALTGDHLLVFDGQDSFNAWVDGIFVDKFGEYKESDRMHVRLRSKLKARANDVEVDSSGRIMLPAEIRAAAGIDKEVVIVGDTGRFEIWDAKRYEQVDAEVDLGLFYS